MQQIRHCIQFPKIDVNNLNQSETYFYLLEPGADKTKIRFHDYDLIYSIPGLYEQLFYDRLKCTSPTKVTDILKKAVDQSDEDFFGLRVLDLGAGNGLVGEALKKYGVSRLVGVDIIPEAKRAMERDRPQYYDAYYITDFCNMTTETNDEFET